jgi:ribonuclease P protein subunit RPR2
MERLPTASRTNRSNFKGNKQAYARISYLYQSANFILAKSTAEASSSSKAASTTKETDAVPEDLPTDSKGLPAYYSCLISSTARKTQSHISPELKRTVCKGCSSLLVSGKSATTSVENRSRNGRKPWADVLVIECHQCGMKKRFPVGTKRRVDEKEKKEEEEKPSQEAS